MKTIIKGLEQQIKNFNKAIKYLDQCGEFDFDYYKKVHHIAGTDTQKFDLSEMWSDAKLVLSSPGHPGGVESLREITRNSLLTGISEAQKLLEVMKKI